MKLYGVCFGTAFISLEEGEFAKTVFEDLRGKCKKIQKMEVVRDEKEAKELMVTESKKKIK